MVSIRRLDRSGRTLLAFADDLQARLGCDGHRISGSGYRSLEQFPFTTADLLVSNAPHRRDVTTLFPFDEEGLLVRNLALRALIPLSNDESGKHAAAAALPILAKLGFEALLWHTTWRDGGNPSPDARQHLTLGAKAAIAAVEAMAAAAKVPFRTVVDATDSVPYGIALAALREECAMIVMARGLEAVRGSYVDSVLSATCVPTLVVGRPEGGAQ